MKVFLMWTDLGTDAVFASATVLDGDGAVVPNPQGMSWNPFVASTPVTSVSTAPVLRATIEAQVVEAYELVAPELIWIAR